VGLDRENVPTTFGDYAELMSPVSTSEFKVKDGLKVIPPPEGASRVSSYCSVRNRQELLDATERYCALRGGTFRSLSAAFGFNSTYKWCETSDSRGPLYGYSIRQANSSCFDLEYHYTTTPKPSTDFIEHVSAHFGYRTIAAEKVERELVGIEMQRRVDQHRAKQEMDSVARSALVPHMNTKGTTLCLLKGGFIYQGVVEDFSETKLKLWVQSARLPGTDGVQPGGFQPHAAWVDPLEWYPCS
jgi:hypothetical protein